LSDYVFDWDKMLAMNGNTGAYLQYGYARTRNIYVKCGASPAAIVAKNPRISLDHPAERALAVEFLRFPETLELAGSELKLNILTDYLFGLTGRFYTFYDKCPVLKAETDELRESRLAICELTGRILRRGLAILGIEVVDRM